MIGALQDELVKQGLVDEVEVLETSRIGNPETEGPDLMVYPETVHYANLTIQDIPSWLKNNSSKVGLPPSISGNPQKTKTKNYLHRKPKRCVLS